MGFKKVEVVREISRKLNEINLRERLKVCSGGVVCGRGR